jgi:hypothetical protein
MLVPTVYQAPRVVASFEAREILAAAETSTSVVTGVP